MKPVARWLHGVVFAFLVQALPRAAIAEPESFTFGLGLAGTAGGVWLDRPDATALSLPASGDVVSYPSFSGFTGGAGLFLEGRVFGVVGIEVDVFYTPESLGGDATRDGRKVRIAVSQPSVRVPILAKGVLPLGAWSPFLAAGPELAFYGLSSVSTDPDDGLRAVASADPGLWLLLAAGVEWKVPVSAVDLRVPLSLRVGVNPSVSDELNDRATALPSDAVVLESTPRVRATLTAGAGVHF